jgi:hypothetical protein
VILLGLLAAVLVMGQAAPASAPAVATAAPADVIAPKATVITYAPPKAADQKPDQLVCKMENPIGSRIPVRRCRSVGDIADKALQDRMQIEHAQQNIQMR